MSVRRISPWGQLLGFEQYSGPESGSDRRFHVRHVCDLLATCRAAKGENHADVLAAVTNISRGGIGLLTDRSFERGAVLAVELPMATDEPVCKLLACVLHASERSDGLWSLGCAFVTELEEADLQSFGVQPCESTEEHRTGERHPCELRASYRPIGVRVNKPCRGTVIDVSSYGVGMVTEQEIELGGILRLELHRPGGQSPLKTLACVVRVEPRGDGLWLWGCNFIRQMNEKELASLVSMADVEVTPVPEVAPANSK